MRPLLIALPLLLVAAPAAAQYAPPPGYDVPPPPPGYGAPAPLAGVLADPHLADRLADTLGAITDAVMNIPVGEVEAAVEGRPATLRDHRRTLGSEQERRDPYFRQRLQRQIADSRGAIRAGQQTMVRTLPVVTRALGQATEEINRAIDNLPRSDYPRY